MTKTVEELTDELHACQRRLTLLRSRAGPR
jgi:hypothetical protein